MPRANAHILKMRHKMEGFRKLRKPMMILMAIVLAAPLVTAAITGARNLLH